MQTTLDVKIKDKIMGKTLISKIKCKWNWLISKLTFEVDSCPSKMCTCK